MSLEWVTAGHTGPHTKAATAPVFCLSRDLPSYSDESLKIGMFSMRSLEPIVSRRAWCACSAANHLRGQSPHWETRSSNMRNGRCSGLHLFLGHTAAEGAVVYPPSYSCLDHHPRCLFNHLTTYVLHHTTLTIPTMCFDYSPMACIVLSPDLIQTCQCTPKPRHDPPTSGIGA